MHSHIKFIVLGIATCITMHGAHEHSKQLKSSAAQLNLAAAAQQLNPASDTAFTAVEVTAKQSVQLARLGNKALMEGLVSGKYEYLKDPKRKAQLIAAASCLTTQELMAGLDSGYDSIENDPIKKAQLIADFSQRWEDSIRYRDSAEPLDDIQLKEQLKIDAKKRAEIIHKLVPDSSDNPLCAIKNNKRKHYLDATPGFYRIIYAAKPDTEHSQELIELIKSLEPETLYLLSREYPGYVHLSYTPY